MNEGIDIVRLMHDSASHCDSCLGHARREETGRQISQTHQHYSQLQLVGLSVRNSGRAYTNVKVEGDRRGLLHLVRCLVAGFSFLTDALE